MKTKFISLLFLLLAMGSFAQENDRGRSLRPGLSAAILTGGEISTKAFYYKSGYGIYASATSDLSPYFSLSFVGGLEFLEDETFSPVFAEFAIKPAPQRGHLLIADIGYAFGEHARYRLMEGYQFSGGRLLAIGWQRSIPLRDEHQFTVSLKYRSQVASLSFSREERPVHEEKLDYSMLVIGLGLRF